MKKRINVLFIGLVFVCMLSAAARAETFHAYLTGEQEVGPVATNGRGYARIVLNESAGTISFTIVYNNLSSNQTASHIHAPAPVGMNAGIAINLGASGGTSGVITGMASITSTQISQLRSNLGYVNVHSANHPGGEIRGQIGKRRPVDFDGDGRTDYSILRFPAGNPAPLQWFNSNSTNGFESVIHGDANTDFPAPGDFDGDGEDDYSIYRAGASAGLQSNFFIIRSSDSTLMHFAWGVFGDQAITRDYDGDGITDIAVFRRGATATAQTTWFIRRSSDNTAMWIPFGLTGNGTTQFDTPVPGDYDGDGKFDIAVYRFGLTPANTFIVMRSSDNSVFFQPWGNFTTDWIVPGDYDGDGKFDFAAARTGATATTPMVWWIRRSSDNATTVTQFGLSADFPTQGDFDGDARTDIAVYRPGATTSAQSNFFVLNSFNNTVTFKPWGLGGDFPVNRFDAR